MSLILTYLNISNYLIYVKYLLAPYFKNCLSANDLDELNIEIIRNTLYKAYLEDFYRYCKGIGGATGQMMSEMLEVRFDYFQAIYSGLSLRIYQNHKIVILKNIISESAEFNL